MARINPLSHALAGAAAGFLNFQLNAEMQRLHDEAQLAKEQRLLAIQREEEERGNKEWERRTRIEHENQLVRDQLSEARATRRMMMQQDFQSTEGAKDRAHDVRMEQTRFGHQLDATDHAAEIRREDAEMEAIIRRRESVYDKVFDAAFERELPPKPGDAEGVYGSDGQFYPVGKPMPAGVTPTVGFGATNLGLRGTPSGRAPGSHRGSTVPATGAAAQPGSSQTNPKAVFSVAEAQALPPGTWIRLPNGKVGQR